MQSVLVNYFESMDPVLMHFPVRAAKIGLALILTDIDADSDAELLHTPPLLAAMWRHRKCSYWLQSVHIYRGVEWRCQQCKSCFVDFLNTQPWVFVQFHKNYLLTSWPLNAFEGQPGKASIKHTEVCGCVKVCMTAYSHLLFAHMIWLFIGFLLF